MTQDTPNKIADLQNEMWLRKSPEERARFVFGMFSFARRVIISTISDGLSDHELKRQVYERTYGEPLPEDFFEKTEGG